MEQQFHVTGMSCAACSAHVEKAVSAITGVQLVQVNLLAGSMKVGFDPKQTDENAIIETVVNAGYGASVKGKQAAASQTPDDRAELAEMQRRIIHGAHGWASIAILFGRQGKCRGFCPDTAFADTADCHCE